MKLTLLKENFDRFIRETSAPKIKIQSLEDFVKSEQGSVQEAEGDMLGANPKTMSPEDMQAMLGRTVAGTKTAADKFNQPYVHKSNIEIVNSESGKKINLDALKKAITERPTKILKQNEKIVHSGGGATEYFNVGLPAMRGLAVNEKTGEFIVVNTCPGAGACKLYCYAKKGGYVQWKASSLSQTKVLNFLLNDPDGFKNVMESEIASVEKKYKGKNVKIVVRWHDSGDFFSDAYLQLGYDIARDFPNVDFYAYTKMASAAMGDKPKNFLMNFSAGAVPSQEKQVDLSKTKHSQVVPKELFGDLIIKSASGKIEKDAEGHYAFVDNAMNILKDRMAKKYGIDRDTILTYDEMMAMEPGNEQKYNVIVSAGNGDNAANRPDVLGTYLLIH